MAGGKGSGGKGGNPYHDKAGRFSSGEGRAALSAYVAAGGLHGSPEPGATPHELAIRDYTGSWATYHLINGPLRSGLLPTGHAAVAVHLLDEAIASSPPLTKPKTVYRGVKWDLVKGMRAGDRYTDHGFTSVGPEEFRWKREHFFAIELPVGLRALAVRGGGPWEELILPRGLTFEVVGNQFDTLRIVGGPIRKAR